MKDKKISAVGMLNESIKLALKHHGNQWYGDKPYLYHLVNVYSEVYKYEKNQEILSLAFLHDTLEDTNIDRYQLFKISPNMPEYVECLTKRPKESYYDKCSKYYCTSIVKAADRIVNITECLSEFNLKNKRQFKQYYNERKKFRILYPKLPFKMILNLECLYLKGLISNFRTVLL